MSFLRPLGNACHAWHSQYSPGIWLLHAFSLSVFKAKFPKFQVKHRIESCHWTVYTVQYVSCALLFLLSVNLLSVVSVISVQILWHLCLWLLWNLAQQHLVGQKQFLVSKIWWGDKWKSSLKIWKKFEAPTIGKCFKDDIFLQVRY